MKRFFVLMAAVAFVSAVYAQEQDMTIQETTSVTSSNYEMEMVRTNVFADNWEIGFHVGTHFYMGEYDYHADFMDWWSFPTLEVSVGKWASPFFGLGLNFIYSKYKGLSFPNDMGATFYSADAPAYGDGTFVLNEGSYINLNFYGIFDLANIMRGGYRHNSRYHLEAFVGGGILKATETDVTRFGGAIHAGLRNQWMLNDRWSIDATIRGSIISDDFDGEYWYNGTQRAGIFAEDVPMDGELAVTIGATYRFGFDRKSPTAVTWLPVGTIVEKATEKVAAQERSKVEAEFAERNNEKLDKVAAAATYAGVDVARLTNDRPLADRALANARKYADYVNLPESKTIVKNTVTPFWIPIHFAIDKFNITHYEEVSVIAAADAIKALPEGVKVHVTGYADIQTASPAYNQALSERRANVVADMLVNKYGVNRDCLIVSAQGGVDTKWLNDNKLTRCVVISLGEE